VLREGREWRTNWFSDLLQAFIVDDSASMAPVWADVQRVFEALSYTVKGMSPEGTELFFTISCECSHQLPLVLSSLHWMPKNLKCSNAIVVQRN